MKKRTLIHDIAQHLDVSITTVSMVLNGRAKEYRISDGLAQRVQQYVEQVGYKPNQLAQSLRTGKSYVIGLIIEDISNPFFATVARLVERHAFQGGYRLLFCSTDNDPSKTRDLLAMFQQRHIDGYIIAPPAGLEREVRGLLKSNIPTVLFDRYLPNLSADYIVVDGEAGVYEATCHLLGQGLTRVAFVTTESRQTQMAGRLLGYRRAMHAQQLPTSVKRVPLDFAGSKEQSVAAICAFLQRHPACEAVIFANNSLTLHGLEAIARLGRRIPDDLAVISFDDNAFFQLYSPTITAIAQPVEALAETLIQVLLHKLSDDGPADAPVREIALPTILLVRQSSVRPRP